MAPIQHQLPDWHYIPTGCLEIDLSHVLCERSLSQLPHLEKWCWFGLGVCRAASKEDCLDSDSDRRLLDWLYPDFRLLLEKQWIQMMFRRSLDDPEKAVIRVYLLPDDVARSHIDRSEKTLRDARIDLLSKLDYSPAKWEGRVGSSHLTAPQYFDEWLRSSDDKQQSLLELFNNLPAPNPQPDKICDLDARDIATELLENNDLAGLRTKLYPYQQRSVALMIQKEYQPEKVLDPRYLKVADQDGNPWFYDAVTGTPLAQPRFYDTVSGGILAEEMGSGKTVMCLALILATKHQSSKAPDIHQNRELLYRKKIGSLADMAAATATRSGSPWKLCFDDEGPLDYDRCRKAIRRNPGYYYLPATKEGRSRSSRAVSAPRKIQLCHATLVIVPANLVKQWKQEISKHTTGLKFISVDHKQEPPTREEILQQDVILFSKDVFMRLWPVSSLTEMHFKRCIVDEGHRLGTSYKSALQQVLDSLQITSRWIVSGTPAKGLYGAAQTSDNRTHGRNRIEASPKQEAQDLKRIGAIATQYLKARPWANTLGDLGDTLADWSVYVMQRGHSNRSSGRQDCLRATMASLIIRHRSDELSQHLPRVNETVVLLDGSYQDKLCINLFSMIIIFNAVTSERKDEDYFFHQRQLKHLTELISNLKQANFFGGWFFPTDQITEAISTAEKFLEEGKVQISKTDESLLREAIAFGRQATQNHLKRLSAEFQMVPIYVKDFPGGAEDKRAWSLDSRTDDPVCTNSNLLRQMQMFLRPIVNAPYNLEKKFKNGDFRVRGSEVRQASSMMVSITKEVESGSEPGTRLAPPPGRAKSSTKTAKRLAKVSLLDEDEDTEAGVADVLARARVVSTASAKLSYLIGQVVKYQHEEQIIIFYDHDNEAYIIGEMLEMLQIQHLIYSHRIAVDRRAQYMDTFNYSAKFR